MHLVVGVREGDRGLRIGIFYWGYGLIVWEISGVLGVALWMGWGRYFSLII